MAALRCRFVSGSVAASVGAAKTVVQLVAASNQRVKLTNLGVFLDGVASSAVPVQVRILRQTTAGTFSSTTNAPTLAEKGLDETPQTNYQVGATAEPTAGDVLR